MPHTEFRRNSRRTVAGILLTFAVVCLVGCAGRRTVNPELGRTMPPRMLWAWERKEDLRFLDPAKFGVAFHAQTLKLTKNEVLFQPRRQPLETAPGTYIIAVTRIETEKKAESRALLSADQRAKLVGLVKRTLELPNVRAVQIDYDAAVSERRFYREFMNDLRTDLPDEIPLTMTALASWCIGDAWFNDLPVDEAVPMAFVMGADSDRVRDFLAKGNDWREPLCRGSYGFAVEEPINAPLRPERRIYYFKSSAWERADIDKLR
ncbi:MAG: DUF3142 domain-containing protein [Acidobacteria bacterium]|nr:DUF3142 domain-containing protein [Acidobacteriota bacterium]